MDGMSQEESSQISMALDAVMSKYGEFSSAALLLKYLRLIDSIKRGAEHEGPAPTEHEASSHRALTLHFENLSASIGRGVHDGFVREKVLDDCVALEYDREHFDEVHGEELARLGDRVSRLADIDVMDSALYTYSVTQAGDILVDRKPNDLDSLFREGGPEKVNHAHLVERHGLRVRCAGEAFFIRAGGKPVGAIVNNRSGHFYPAKRHLLAVLPIFQHALGLDPGRVFGLYIDREYHGI
jgi:hypothetical protein